MVNVDITPSKTPEKTVSAFMETVRSLNQTAQLFKSIPPKAFRERYRREATSYERELARLEKTIQQLRARLSKPEAEVRQARERVVVQAATTVDDSTDAVRATLEQMVQQKKLLSSTQFIAELDWSRQALSKALTSKRVFYVDYRGDRYFPAFYADPAFQRSELEAVTKVLGDLPGGAKLQFFLTRKGSLGSTTPLQALAQGKQEQVKDVAAAFAEA